MSPLYLPDFNQVWIFSTHLYKNSQYKI